MNTLNVSSWADFPLGGKSGLFNIVRPDARGQNDYDEGDIPFVASGSFNNGVMKYCSPKLNEKLDKKNCISVSPVDGYAFYQENDFLGRGGAGSSIILLYNEKLNKLNGQFICTVIRKRCSSWTYNNMGSKSKLENMSIKLPFILDTNNEKIPDWDFMESYMIGIYKSAQQRYTQLKKIIENP